MKTIWDTLNESSLLHKKNTSSKTNNHNYCNLQKGSKILVSDSFLKEEKQSIEKVLVYETNVGSHLFYHTDYCFSDCRIRILKDKKEHLGYKSYLLHTYDQKDWDDNFFTDVLCDKSGIISLAFDETGGKLDYPWIYWRIEDVSEPYHAKVFLENKTFDVTYWDYHRLTDGYGGNKIEYLTVEMNNTEKTFTFLLGTTFPTYQIHVI